MKPNSLYLIGFCLATGTAESAARAAAPEQTPVRIILTEDGGALRNWDVPPTKEIIEEFMSRYAGQGVDVISYGLLGAHLAVYESQVCNMQHIDPPFDDSLAGKNLRHMVGRAGNTVPDPFPLGSPSPTSARLFL